MSNNNIKKFLEENEPLIAVADAISLRNRADNIETLIKQVDDLDDQIFTLEQSIADKVNALRTKRSEMNELLNDEVAKQATEDLKDKEYGCGTVNIETARHKIKFVVAKKVKWDEKQLFGIRQSIVDAGQDPSQFIKEKLSVTETAYKDFSPEIQKVFEPARTVEPSKPTIKIERK